MLSIVNESVDITGKPRNLSDEIIEFWEKTGLENKLTK